MILFRVAISYRDVIGEKEVDDYNKKGAGLPSPPRKTADVDVAVHDRFGVEAARAAGEIAIRRVIGNPDANPDFLEMWMPLVDSIVVSERPFFSETENK